VSATDAAKRSFLWYFPEHERQFWSHFARKSQVGEFDRITRDPGVMGGKACIRGMRVTVGMIVGQIGDGRTVGDLLASYPYLEREDILQALRYAARLADEREVVLAGLSDLSVEDREWLTIRSVGRELL
jgi:uncharacterized protein (DUF433 family)